MKIGRQPSPRAREPRYGVSEGGPLQERDLAQAGGLPISSLARLAAIVFMIFCACPARADAIADKAEVCGSCHGDKGVPQEKITPVIWGQSVGYLYLQLRDFKKGARADDVMQAIVADIEKDEMLALAEYFSAKPWPSLGQPTAPDAVARQALAANGSVGCTGCHLDKYQGDGGSVPRLAGQSRDYMTKTVAEFRSRARANNPGMSDLMKATPEPDLAALAQFLAGL